MINKKIIVPILFAVGVLFNPVSAQSTTELNASLKKLMPGITPSSITESQIPGLYEVSFSTSVYYFSKDGKLMVRGDIIDVTSKKNLTEKKRNEERSKLLQAMDDSQMIVYPAEKEVAKITIFTDINCPYCVKMHRNMSAYNDLGITVRYMAYPRSGPGSASFKQYENVWCSNDRKKAMDDAKEGVSIKDIACDNPVAQQFKLGQQLGVRGTPSMFMEDGTNFPGYVTPGKLAKRLNIISPTNIDESMFSSN